MPSAVSCKAKRDPIRVGVLCGLASFSSIFDGFKARLTELGYQEGKSIVYDLRQPEATEMVVQTSEEFVAAKVDLIFAFPTDAALRAKKAGAAGGIKVLFANSNIEGVDLVDSVRSPGKGITGIRFPGPDITVKRFEILSQIAPRAKRYLMPYRSDVDIMRAQMAALAPVAEAAGIGILPQAFKDAAELEAYVRTLPRSGPAPFDAVLMATEPLMLTKAGFLPIAAYASARGIPIGGATMEADGYKSLFGVSTDNVSVGRQAADMANKIFKGAEPGNLPVVSAEYYIEIDLGAAEKAGLSIPESLLKRADKVVK
jgi:putative tryptophan/tyrosine transport system substrate-binding protein